MKYVGEVIDDAYWQAWKESNQLEAIRQVERDYLDMLIKKTEWISEEI